MKNNLIKYVFCVCLLTPITIATGTENAEENTNNFDPITTINYCKKNTLSDVLERNRKALAELNKLKQSVVKPIIQENICTPGKFEKNELFRQIMIWIEQKRAKLSDKFAFGASPSFYQYGFSSTIVYWDLVSDKYKPKQDEQITATSIVNSFRCVGANLCEALHYYTMLVQKYNNELCDENGKVYDFVLDDLRLYISSRLSRSENISNISYIKGVLSFALIMDELLKTIPNKTESIPVTNLMNEKDAKVFHKFQKNNRNLYGNSLYEVKNLHDICGVSSLIDMITREFNSVIKNGIKDNRTESRTIIKNGSKNKRNKNKTTEYKIAESMKVSIYDKLPNYYVLMRELGTNAGNISIYKATDIFNQIIEHIDNVKILDYTDIERKSNYLLSNSETNALVETIKNWLRYYQVAEFEKLCDWIEKKLHDAFNIIQKEIDGDLYSVMSKLTHENGDPIIYTYPDIKRSKKQYKDSKIKNGGSNEKWLNVAKNVSTALDEINAELNKYAVDGCHKIIDRNIDKILENEYDKKWRLQLEVAAKSAITKIKPAIDSVKSVLTEVKSAAAGMANSKKGRGQELSVRKILVLQVEAVKRAIEELHKWMVAQIKDNLSLQVIKSKLDEISKLAKRGKFVTNRDSYCRELFDQELIIKSNRGGPAFYNPDYDPKKENGSESGPAQSSNKTNNKINDSYLQGEYVPQNLDTETDPRRYEFDKTAIATEIYKRVLDTATDCMAKRWIEWGERGSRLEECPEFDYVRYDMQQFFKDDKIRKWSGTFEFLRDLTKYDFDLSRNYQDMVCSCDGSVQLSDLSKVIKESIKMYINRNGLSLNNETEFTISDCFYYPELYKFYANKPGVLFKGYKYNYNILTLSGSAGLNTVEREHKFKIAFSDKCSLDNELFEVERHIPNSHDLEDVKIYLDYCQKYGYEIGACIINTPEFEKFAKEVAEMRGDNDIEMNRLCKQIVDVYDTEVKVNPSDRCTQDSSEFDLESELRGEKQSRKKSTNAKFGSNVITDENLWGDISVIK